LVRLAIERAERAIAEGYNKNNPNK
jgi:hypothetical protein